MARWCSESAEAVLGDDHQAEDAFQATFLILASRARSIRRHVSIASWLYGVALRVAGTERSRAARRKRHERRHAEMTSGRSKKRTTAPPDDEAVRAHSPRDRAAAGAYRSAVVLCYLEGLTHETGRRAAGASGGNGAQPAGDGTRSTASPLDPPRVCACGHPGAHLARRVLRPSSGRARRGDGARLIQCLARKDRAGGRRFRGSTRLMKETLKTMMITRWACGCALVLAAGFVTSGAGAMAFSHSRRRSTTSTWSTRGRQRAILPDKRKFRPG